MAGGLGVGGTDVGVGPLTVADQNHTWNLPLVRLKEHGVQQVFRTGPVVGAGVGDAAATAAPNQGRHPPTRLT